MQELGDVQNQSDLMVDKLLDMYNKYPVQCEFLLKEIVNINEELDSINEELIKLNQEL